MSNVREIIVFVENLTSDEFQLEDTFTDNTGARARLKPGFERSVKLSWECSRERSVCMAEYGSTKPNSSSSSLGSYDTRPQRRFVIAATLPSVRTAQKVGRWAASWVPGMESSGPCFAASLTTPRRWLGNLPHHLDDIMALGNGTGEGCEWFVVRNDDEVVEIRLRLIPEDDTLARQESPPLLPEVDEGQEEECANELSQDEAAMRRLRGYLTVISKLNAQACRLDDLSAQEPMSISRVRELPDKVRIDLLLAVLCVLCRHREIALQRMLLTTDEAEAEDTLTVPNRNARSPEKDPEKLNRFSESLHSHRRALKHAVQGKDDYSQKVAFGESLKSHAENVFRALVPMVGFEDARTSQKVADLVRCYLPPNSTSEEALSVAAPDPSIICSSVCTSLNTRESVDDWDVKQACQVGLEDALARFLDSARLIDGELASSLSTVVDGLNTGRLFCPEDFCFVYSNSDDMYVLLYRRGKKDEAFAHLGIATDDDLQLPPPISRSLSPREKPLRILGRQLLVEQISGEHPDQSLEQSRDETKKVDDSPTISASDIPRAWLVARDFFAMTVGSGAGSFDARSRAALYDFAATVGVPPRLMGRWENEIGGSLFELLEASSVMERQQKDRKKWNRAKVGMAAAGGGVLLAVTAGFAAPVLAAGMTAAGGGIIAGGSAIGLTQAGIFVGGAVAAFGAALASLGVAGAAVLFGATGAGLTGWKLNRRWGDLEEFEFVPLEKKTMRRDMVLDVLASDARTVKTIDEALETGNGVIEKEMVVKTAEGAEVALCSGSELERRECYMRSTQDRAGYPISQVPAVRYHLARHVDVQERAVHVAIFVTGWLQTEDDFTKPWAEAAKVCFPSSGHLAIRWETQGLLDLNKMMKDMITNEVASTSANLWLKGVAAGATTAGSFAAMAAVWPVTIISAMSNLDNAWLVSIERARLAGHCLAHVLADRQSVGQRPVTLVGHSMGARLLFYCMLELYRLGEFHVVDDVVLLGAPVSTRPDKWRKVRAVASGRVVNGYLRGDWVLAFFYRYLEWGLTVAGLSSVNLPGVESVNLKGLGIKTHSDYPNHITDILSKMAIGERRVFVV